MRDGSLFSEAAQVEKQQERSRMLGVAWVGALFVLASGSAVSPGFCHVAPTWMGPATYGLDAALVVAIVGLVAARPWGAKWSLGAAALGLGLIATDLSVPWMTFLQAGTLALVLVASVLLVQRWGALEAADKREDAEGALAGSPADRGPGGGSG